MRQINELIGMSVVAGDTGEELGHVREVIVHRANKCIIGLLLDRASWFHQARIVPFSKVTSLDDVTASVPSAGAIVGSEQFPVVPGLFDESESGHIPLISSNGHEIGEVHAAYFEDQTGMIEGFDVSLGSSGDALTSHIFLPQDNEITVGKNFVLLSEQAADRLMHEVIEMDH